ncbi:MAG: hypothetical protein MRZ79_07510 [Bacteroidia bacterium]|nr:hypothetical protein [Bacteroidia bacterium]
MATKSFLQSIRTALENDDIPDALKALQALLEHTPKLNEVLHQSGRYADITKQIRLGTISFEEAKLSKNQIRKAILDLVSEIDSQSQKTDIRKELESAISVVNSKNTLINSPISAGGNVQIGDNVQTESTTSRRLRIFLFVLVPLLAISVAFFWYNNQVLNQDLSLKVRIRNQTPSEFLPDPKGKLTLYFGSDTKTKEQQEKEVIFDAIPGKVRGKEIRLEYLAPGFVSLDTSFVLRTQSVDIPVYRNDYYSRLQGSIFEPARKENSPDLPVEGALVQIDGCCEAMTDQLGQFRIDIPFEFQKKKQRILIKKAGYYPKDYTSPIIKGETLEDILIPITQ